MTSIPDMESKRIHEIPETHVKVIQQNNQRLQDLGQKVDSLEKVVQAIVQKLSHPVPKNNEQINRVEMKLMMREGGGEAILRAFVADESFLKVLGY
jgi:hypothetical protein